MKVWIVTQTIDWGGGCSILYVAKSEDAADSYVATLTGYDNIHVDEFEVEE